jgi:methyltransferase (TIGR00027 family)
MLLQRLLNSDGSLPDPVPKPSALRVAILRAAHQLLDAPLIFDDRLALQILGAGEEALLRSDPSKYDTSRLRGLRTSLVVRSRLAEDEWARSRRRGVRQYVILGAGLDTLAYRDQEDDGSRIFEVDLPATQEWKRHCLRVAAIPEPARLTFVPIDFERSTLAAELKQATFDENAPAFFSWLGVTMYLEEAAIISTLRFVASLSPGSGVVFDYGVLPALLSAGERSSIELLSTRAAEQGEHWKTFFDPTIFAGQLRSLGFQEVEDLGPEQVYERYLAGRTDGLRKSGAARLICAKN